MATPSSPNTRCVSDLNPTTGEILNSRQPDLAESRVIHTQVAEPVHGATRCASIHAESLPANPRTGFTPLIQS